MQTALALPSTNLRPGSGRFLRFKTAGEHFAIPVLRVREILILPALTQVPGLPEYIRGVLNLRDQVLPVMDLGLRLGMGRADESKRACVVVVTTRSETARTRTYGLIVEEVDEVFGLPENGDASTRPQAAPAQATCLSGLLCLGDRILGLLDLDRVLPDSATC